MHPFFVPNLGACLFSVRDDSPSHAKDNLILVITPLMCFFLHEYPFIFDGRSRS